MKKLTQKQIILSLLRDEPNKWFWSYDLQKISTKYGWLGTSGDRRARELREEGRLESISEGKYEKYRYKPKYETKSVPTIVEREGRSVCVMVDKQIEVI